jgi:hypothetical protein
MEETEEPRLLGFDESIAISTSISVEVESSQTLPKRGANKKYDFFSEYTTIGEAKLVLRNDNWIYDEKRILKDGTKIFYKCGLEKSKVNLKNNKCAARAYIWISNTSTKGK